MNGDGTMISRRRAVAYMSAAAALGSLGMPLPALASETSNFSPTILGNKAQIEAERIVLRLLDDADVEALRSELRAELSEWPRGKAGDGEDVLDHALLLWTTALIFAEYSYVQRENPAFLVGTDDTRRTWFGHTLEGNGIAGDNPDAIYRSAALEGTGRYEIIGQIDPSRPSAQLYFSVSEGTMTRPAPVANEGKPNPDAGIITLLGDIGDEDLQVASDGSFRIMVGGPQTTGNYLPLKPGRVSLGLRQMVLDWNTPPLRLDIRRLDNHAAKPFDVVELKKLVLEDLGGFVRFWAKFPDVWLGGVAPNRHVPPAPRAGGWGFISGVNFDLGVDEAVVLTVHPGKAKYMGFQITDPWMICLDSARAQSCLNLAQSTPDDDGRFTYVISPVDPGVANWLDTSGLTQGFGIIRWQNFPGGITTNDGLLQDFRIVKLSEIEALPGVARVSPVQRAERLSARKKAYFSRYTAV